MKKKSAEKWALRNDRTTEQMAAKQKKRKDSLKGRADVKVEKRIEKREKREIARASKAGRRPRLTSSRGFLILVSMEFQFQR